MLTALGTVNAGLAFIGPPLWIHRWTRCRRPEVASGCSDSIQHAGARWVSASYFSTSLEGAERAGLNWEVITDGRGLWTFKVSAKQARRISMGGFDQNCHSARTLRFALPASVISWSVE